MGELVDRAFREFIYASDDQPMRTTLASGVTDPATSWTVDMDLFAADEADAIGAGVIVEAGREQALVTDVDGSTLTVIRGVNGTTAAAHSSGDFVTIAPAFGRQFVFDPVADNVVGLYPSLWRVDHAYLAVDHPLTEAPAEAVYAEGFYTGRHMFSARVIDTAPQFASGRAVVVDRACPEGTEGWLAYHAKFPRPTLETADLDDDFGIEGEWERIVLIGAAAQILSGTPELRSTSQRWVTEQLQSENYPPTTAAEVASRLLSMHRFLLDRASKQLRARHQTRIAYNPPARRALT